MWHCLLNKHQQNIFIGLKKNYISFIRFFSFFLIKDVTKFLFTPSILFFLPLRCLKMILNIPFIDSPAESFYGKTFIQTLNLHFRSSPIIHHQLPVIELLHILLHFLLILLLLLQCQGSFCVLLKHGGWCSRKWQCRRNAGRHWRVAITIGLSYWERCCYVFVHTVNNWMLKRLHSLKPPLFQPLTPNKVCFRYFCICPWFLMQTNILLKKIYISFVIQAPLLQACLLPTQYQRVNILKPNSNTSLVYYKVITKAHLPSQ